MVPVRLLWVMLWLHASVCYTAANLYHIPGLGRQGSSLSEDGDDANRELYFVCSEAEDDQPEDVFEVVAQGADMDWVSPDEGMTCLLSAVMRGKLQVVETMLALGADVTIPRQSDGVTAVHAASMYGRALELQALQKHGYLDDVEQSLHGIPLLHHACQGFSAAHKRALTFLVEQGADVNQKDWLGRTCLDKAWSKNLIYHIEDLGGKKEADLH